MCLLNDFIPITAYALLSFISVALWPAFATLHPSLHAVTYMQLIEPISHNFSHPYIICVTLRKPMHRTHPRISPNFPRNWTIALCFFFYTVIIVGLKMFKMFCSCTRQYSNMDIQRESIFWWILLRRSCYFIDQVEFNQSLILLSTNFEGEKEKNAQSQLIKRNE